MLTFSSSWYIGYCNCYLFSINDPLFFKEEEARARKAKEEEAAALEFEKWKGDFSIDAEGTTENELQDESRGLLFDFVEYIKAISSPPTSAICTRSTFHKGVPFC